MLTTKDVLSLTELKPPVATAYVEAMPAAPTNGKPTPENLIWLRREGKGIAKNLSPSEQKMFERQLRRMEEFLTDRTPKEKGIVIVAGPKIWKTFPLQANPENELHWGKPAVSRLLEIVGEQTPAIVVLVDRSGARFFRYELGRMEGIGEHKFTVDSTEWKKKVFGKVARVGMTRRRGPQRDIYAKRVEAQYQHLCKQAAKKTLALSKKNGANSLFLVGSKRLTEQVEAALPQKLRLNTTLVAEDVAKLPIHELQERLADVIAEAGQAHAKRGVTELLEAEHGAVLGFDETLAQVQSGHISTVLMVHGLNADMKKCLNCGLVERSADPVCHLCGAARQAVTLGEVLPELLRLHKTEIKVVNGAAGEKLRGAGGIGGWLRQAKTNGKS